MTAAARSVLVFGFYLAGLGSLLIAVPDTMLGLFGLGAGPEVWIRVVGMLVLFLGYYYARAARENLTPFFRWTVQVRSVVILFFAGFVLAGLAAPVLLLFGAVDLLGAVWTGLALRR